MDDLVKRGFCGMFGVALSASSLVAPPDTLQKMDLIISIICSILGLLFTITTVIVIPVVKKIIKAKKNDGKIDLDEAEDIVDTLKDGIDKVKDKEKHDHD